MSLKRVAQAVRLAALGCAAALVLVDAVSSTAAAQAWPQRAVRVIVPFAAGGNTDAIARIAAERLAQVTGQQFVVENRTGAGGAIAAEAVARASPDGYTLFVSSVAQLAVLPYIQTVGYDPVKDFAPISIIGSNPLVLGISTTVLPTVKSLRDLIAYVRASPVKVPYASGGTGSLSHLVMIMLVRRGGLAMEHVNYKGGAPAMVDLLGGQVPMYFGNVADYVAHVQSDKLRLLATSGERRSSLFPELPTVAESGYPGFRLVTWNGLLAPAKTPAVIVDRAARIMVDMARDPVIVRRLEQIGVEAIGSTPGEFSTAIANDLHSLGDAISAAGLRVDRP